MEEGQNTVPNVPSVEMPNTEVEQPQFVQPEPTRPTYIAPPPPPKKKGRGSMFKLILFLVIALAALGSGYLVYKNRPLNIKIPVISGLINRDKSNTEEIANSEGVDLTKFMNEAYGYEVHYPKDFIHTVNSDSSEIYIYKKDASVPLNEKYVAINFRASEPEYDKNYTKQYVEINDMMTTRIMGKTGVIIYWIDHPNQEGGFEIEVSNESERQRQANEIFSSFSFGSEEDTRTGTIIDSLAQTRDVERKSDLTAIAGAVYEYAAENNGLLPNNDKFPTEPTCIGNSQECFDLISLGILTPFPKDPSNGTEGNSGYEIFKRTDGRVVTLAKGEIDSLIQVVR